jgi:hypothetical protein
MKIYPVNIMHGIRTKYLIHMETMIIQGIKHILSIRAVLVFKENRNKTYL